jgi:hypothetical protein
MSKQIHDDDGSDKITVRVPSALKAEFKAEADPNMSAVVEELIRDYLDGDDQDEQDLAPYPDPDDRQQAIAYRALCQQHVAGKLQLERAKSAVAQALDHVGKNDVYPILRRLSNRGYLKISAQRPIGNGRGVVYVRPWSKHYATVDKQKQRRRASKRAD